LKVIYPSHPWQQWKFVEQVPIKFWKDMKNQRAYMDTMAKELNIKQPSDWYTVPRDMLIERDGGGLLHHYQSSLPKALAAIYPEFKWETWKFNQVTKHYWDDKENLRTYFEWLAKKLNINSLEEWNQVRLSDVSKNRGAGLLSKYGGSLIRGKLKRL
jgi:hypothetical protein